MLVSHTFPFDLNVSLCLAEIRVPPLRCQLQTLWHRPSLFIAPGVPGRGDSETATAVAAMPARMAHVVLDPGTLPQLLRELLMARAATSF